MGSGHIFLINSKLSAACWCYLHGVVLARTPTSSPLQNEGKEPHCPRQPQAGGGRTYRPGTEAGPWTVLHRISGRESAQALLLSFRETPGSSTRQKARAANGEQKHHGKSCSLPCRVRFTGLLFLSQEDWTILCISLCGFTIRKLMQLKTKLYFLQ